MRVVLDTNVLISGMLIPGGPPGKIVDLWTENIITVIVSQALIEEFFDVLLRPKFKRAGTVIERQDLLMGLLEMENSVFVFPGVRLHVIEDDPEDNHVLECALEGKVQYIISGDTHLLALKEFQGIPIVAPAEFISIFNDE
ncbi:MAG: putative toxin-antitoxin system toxin component, PIN family [Desulfotomaculaceae bacterium]